MFKYYEINGKTCFTDHMDFQCPPEATGRRFRSPRPQRSFPGCFSGSREAAAPSFLVNHEGLLWEKEESVDWLNSRKLEENGSFQETRQLHRGRMRGCTSGMDPRTDRCRKGACRQRLHPAVPGTPVRRGIPGRSGQKAGPYPGHRGCGEHAPYGPPSPGRRRDLPDRDLRYL